MILAVPACAVTFENVALVSVYDGNTIEVTLPGVHPLFGEGIAVRIRGIDSPEFRGKCEAEKAKAIIARDFINGFLKAAQQIVLKNVERDTFFRLVADMEADGQDH